MEIKSECMRAIKDKNHRFKEEKKLYKSIWMCVFNEFYSM